MDATEAIKAMCARSSVSASQASLSIGRARGHISSIVTQRHDVQCSTMARIAHALGYGLYLVPSDSAAALLEMDAIPITGGTDRIMP